ncbi:hypothetical protein ACFWCB_05905 [Streptomyces sp. NPDC060048]|uniref:hypothetical protein n=1 Tax=unclassified Streptomyces TaxID=2593676 RepID=UPI0036D1AD8D
MRADRTCWDAIAGDPVRRATVLRAAQYDRQPADLRLLRTLLRQEVRRGPTEELRLAAVLVALHGETQDHALLRSLRESDPDFHFLLGGFPDSARALTQWAVDWDESNYGQDPHDEYDLTWTALARRQGQTELARAALIRILDDTGPRDAALLGSLANELKILGALRQAIRARRLHASLQDDADKRGAALVNLASLQRRHGEVEAAWQSLQRAVTLLDGPPPPPPTNQLALDLDLPKPSCQTLAWRELGMGVRVTEEHFLITQAAVPLGLQEVTQAALRAGITMLDGLAHPTENLRRPQRLRRRLQHPGPLWNHPLLRVSAGGQRDERALPPEGVVFEGELADGFLVQDQGAAQVGVLPPQPAQVVLHAPAGPFPWGRLCGAGMRGRKCSSTRSR